MTALRRKELVAIAEQLQDATPSPAALAMALDDLGNHGWRIRGTDQEGETSELNERKVAYLARHTELAPLLLRASRTGWTLLLSADGVGCLLSGGHARTHFEAERRIVREHRAGRSLRQIARDLEADGVPTSRGGRWDHSSVAYVLARH